MPILVRDFDYNALSAFVNNDIQGGLTLSILDAMQNSSPVEYSQRIMKECSTYQFFPYYDDGKGSQKEQYLLPIARWDENERDLAYTKIAEQIRKEIN